MKHPLAVIYFSKDRAMQLHASLTSFQRYATNYETSDVFVLFQTDEYQYQYDNLCEEFKTVFFIKETELTKQVHEILTHYKAVLFVVDDTLFYRKFDLAACTDYLLQHSKVLGFSLRLGRNINISHVHNCDINPPVFEKTKDGFLTYKWFGKHREFCYPIEVSSSIYRTTDINKFLLEVKGNPGHIEGQFSRKSKLFKNSHPYLSCLENSVAFSVPVNVVRSETRCPRGRSYPIFIKELATKFDAGLRINTDPPIETINGCHVEVRYRFQ